MVVHRERTVWLGRGALAAALLLGLLLMHGLGHPGQHTAPRPDTPHAVAESHASAVPGEWNASSGSLHQAGTVPVHGSDGAAVCLAVLGAGLGVLLLMGAAHRRPSTGDLAAASPRLAHALRAHPPPAPPGSLLTRLSSLRR
ncbi:hypothetical protein ACRAR1_05480 [Streptomyces sanyensis]|uniref:hypothetical protein n=1 Tax=Streptomyces sanyensis TaxID=568869 RepID=UPI003D776967